MAELGKMGTRASGVKLGTLEEGKYASDLDLGIELCRPLFQQGGFKLIRGIGERFKMLGAIDPSRGLGKLATEDDIGITGELKLIFAEI